MRLDWQRRAVILFTAALLILSVVLVFFAIREAERERLLTERENETARQRLVESIDGRARSLISDAEDRVREAVTKDRAEAARAVDSLKGVPAGRPLVSEVFLVGGEGQITLHGSPPLFLPPGERPGSGEIVRALENDDRWKRADAAEFRLNDPVRAAAVYQDLADKAPDPAAKALALNRLARCLAKSGQPGKAVSAYRQQLRTGRSELASEGIPLEITALYQIGNIHLLRDERPEAAEAFLELYQGLVDAKWALAKDQYESFRKLAEDRFGTAVGGPDAPLGEEWDSRLLSLKRAEEEQLARTAILEKVRERIIPRLRLDTSELDRDSGKTVRIAEPTDVGLLLASFIPLESDTRLGILFDPQVLAAQLSVSEPGGSGPAEGFFFAVIDESGKAIAGRGQDSPEAPEEAEKPRRVLTGAFADSFPPWSIEVYGRGLGAAERQFRLRRTIYVLSLAAVIAALFFGGFLAIRSTAKELKLAKLKSDFTATVSHEFRTPLTSIRYMAELLQRGRVPDEARKQEYYETITGESERLSRLVENLLDFSKIEADVKEYRMEETDIAALAADLAVRFRQQAVFKDFTLETEVAADLPLISADKEALGRAVFNLLDNAVKYSGGDRRVALRVWAGADALHLRVEDRGIGIAKSEQKRIFEKFYRAASATEGDVKGSGIGLPLVEHVVRAHGGEVLLESEPGKGTRVTIRLPLRRTESVKGDEHG